MQSGVEKGPSKLGGKRDPQRGWEASFSMENHPYQVSSCRHSSVYLHACVCVVGTCSWVCL